MSIDRDGNRDENIMSQLRKQMKKEVILSELICIYINKIWIYTDIYICVCIHIHVCTSIYTYTCTCGLYTSECICIYVHMYI